MLLKTHVEKMSAFCLAKMLMKKQVVSEIGMVSKNIKLGIQDLAPEENPRCLLSGKGWDLNLRFRNSGGAGPLWRTPIFSLSPPPFIRPAAARGVHE
jgi:hypothetical protein